MERLNVAILGAGGLGKNAAKIIGMKKELRLVGICDSRGFAFDRNGLDVERIAAAPEGSTVGELSFGKLSRDSIGELLKEKDHIDGIFMALPNLPNDFIPKVTRRIFAEGYQGVLTDALKRTSAVELLFKLDDLAKRSKSVYITGAGATPGLLSAAAVLAAQSFVTVEHVDIFWGVGIPSWEEYRATIREDIAHLPGFTVKKAEALSDEEVTTLLAERDWKLELKEMEHADDILLEKVGVVAKRSQVTVGGVMDTHSDKKPVSTTMTLTGITFEGKRSSHRFILGDETTMPCNVIGPALGYLKRAHWLKTRNIFGIFGSTEFMPMVVK
ncbi:MAG: saccharopine dehydrogenase-like oxidoreductase [Candidatus Omnitrophota bacterium]